MKKLHALGAGVLGVALSATAVLAASPPSIPPGLAAEDPAPADNHGAIVSAVAGDKTQVGGENDNHGGAVSTVARGTHGPSDQADPAATTGKPSTNHGATVSAVAKDKTQVGGENDNHGGAVSTVAKGSHGSAQH